MSNRKLTLAELMGVTAANSAPQGLRLSQLPEILGDATPELPRNPIGRHRLITALKQRFGKNFRALPGVKDLVTEFDTEVEFEKKIDLIKQIKPKRS